MIDIQKADKDRCCCVCHGKKDVYCILFRSEVTNCGIEIPICKNCYARMYLKWDCVVGRW